MSEHFNGRHEGQMEVDSDFVLNGVVTGDLVILNGSVHVNGVVGGAVRALGGSAVVRGVVAGALTEEGGTIRVAVGAINGNKILDADGHWKTPGQGERTVTINADTPTYALGETS